jgi:plasmid stabilization system protein ParE
LALVKLSPAAVADLERLSDFLRESDPVAAQRTVPLIFQAMRVLEEHPLIGRTLDARKRELLIFRGRTGYLAQYSFDFVRNEVVVLSVRHQREVEG